jgi:hypothetical protein
MDIHNGNGMISGPNIDRDDIIRMNELGLSINFDIYVGGNSFKEKTTTNSRNCCTTYR